jgi:hypothetical protein
VRSNESAARRDVLPLVGRFLDAGPRKAERTLKETFN